MCICVCAWVCVNKRKRVRIWEKRRRKNEQGKPARMHKQKDSHLQGKATREIKECHKRGVLHAVTLGSLKPPQGDQGVFLLLSARARRVILSVNVVASLSVRECGGAPAEKKKETSREAQLFGEALAGEGYQKDLRVFCQHGKTEDPSGAKEA